MHVPAMMNSEEAGRLRDRVEECLALAEVMTDPQARQAYVRMAEAYLVLSGNAGAEQPALLASGVKKARRRVKQTTSLKDRLNLFATEMREKASRLPPNERDALLKQARLVDTASHLNDWINSPGLQPPE